MQPARLAKSRLVSSLPVDVTVRVGKVIDCGMIFRARRAKDTLHVSTLCTLETEARLSRSSNSTFSIAFLVFAFLGPLALPVPVYVDRV